MYAHTFVSLCVYSFALGSYPTVGAQVPECQQKVIHEPGTSAISKNIPLSEAFRV